MLRQTDRQTNAADTRSIEFAWGRFSLGLGHDRVFVGGVLRLGSDA